MVSIRRWVVAISWSTRPRNNGLHAPAAWFAGPGRIGFTPPRPNRVRRFQFGGPKLYSEAEFAADDYLVFGRETAGLPKQLLEQHRERWLRIPMFNAQSRSLNLSNCAALVLFEALRQQGFKAEV